MIAVSSPLVGHDNTESFQRRGPSPDADAQQNQAHKQPGPSKPRNVILPATPNDRGDEDRPGHKDHSRAQSEDPDAKAMEHTSDQARWLNDHVGRPLPDPAPHHHPLFRSAAQTVAAGPSLPEWDTRTAANRFEAWSRSVSSGACSTRWTTT